MFSLKLDKNYVKMQASLESASTRSSQDQYNQLIDLNSMLMSIDLCLFQYGKGAMVSLTAVIPIATSIADVSSLDVNISNALINGIRVILIIDQVSESPNIQLEKIHDKYVHELKSVCIKRGSFSSPGRARNEGIQYVDTEFVTFWDADDVVNVDTVARILRNCGKSFDYVVGSYEIRESQPGVSRLVLANQRFPRLRIINQPGVWRIVFRTTQVKNCSFGTSRMGEDQVFLAHSGLLSSSQVFFSEAKFYSYFFGVDGQLTGARKMNSALLVSILEIFRSISISHTKESFYKSLIVFRLFVTLSKRFLLGKR